jgi:hypothetical protein
VIVAGSLYCVFYVFAYWRLAREGHIFAWQKAALLVSTAVVSVYAWGVLHPLEAFFVANFFHGLQYFAIVWWQERSSIRRVFGLSRLANGQILALVAYIVTITAIGVFTCSRPEMGGRLVGSIAITIALMHFWYDGFVWSVRRHQV